MMNCDIRDRHVRSDISVFGKGSWKSTVPARAAAGFAVEGGVAGGVIV